MRIVIDTNVLLSGLLWHGAPHTLLNQVRTGTIELMMSRTLFDEFAEVIARRKFAAILQRTTRTPERLLSELHALAEMVAAPPLPLPVCRDPDDDAVLACALAAHADLIVSGDDDLLTLKEFQHIPIVTAAQAMQRIETIK
ncbi:MAG: putative toxin-antitoxin system toxin component, PIN family [Burkholderiales bacterium]